MSFLDQLWWSFRQAKKQVLESVLIVLAIGLGIGVVITVLSLLFSARTQMAQNEEQEHFRILEIASAAESYFYVDKPLTLLGNELEQLSWRTTLEELELYQSYLPASHHVYVERNWQGQTPLLDVDAGDNFFSWLETNELFLTGTLPSYFSFKNYTLVQGNWFVFDDVENENRVAVVSTDLARDLFAEADPIGQSLPIEGFEGFEPLFYTIIGVFEPRDYKYDIYTSAREKRTAYIPVTVPPYSFVTEEAGIDRVSVGISEGVDLVKAHEVAINEAQLLWGEQIMVRNPLAELRKAQKQMLRYAFIVGVFASIGLVIAVINILNLMLARVLKRTKGIGITMALGSTRLLVFRQFVLEALILGIVGSLLGIGLSFTLNSFLGKVLGTFVAGHGNVLRVVLGISIGFGASLLFGAYPAYLAAKVDPVAALRTD